MDYDLGSPKIYIKIHNGTAKIGANRMNTDTTTLRVIRRFVGRVGQLRFESRCRDQLLILSVQIICWHQLLRLSAESSC